MPREPTTHAGLTAFLLTPSPPPSPSPPPRYLRDPGSLHPAPSSAWERCLAPPPQAAPVRAARARDPAASLRDWRQRLPEELPAACQDWQASPYLDPDLYQFWERLLGSGACRPHHPPHRALKFLARCQPERLRFRFDPDDINGPPAPHREEQHGSRCTHRLRLASPPGMHAGLAGWHVGMAGRLPGWPGRAATPWDVHRAIVSGSRPPLSPRERWAHRLTSHAPRACMGHDPCMF